MRYLSPLADAVVGLFTRCYERRVNGFDAPSWHLVALPGGGAMSEQDAWTMEAIGFARDVRNRLEQDLATEASRQTPRTIEAHDGDQ